MIVDMLQSRMLNFYFALFSSLLISLVNNHFTGQKHISSDIGLLSSLEVLLMSEWSSDEQGIMQWHECVINLRHTVFVFSLLFLLLDSFSWQHIFLTWFHSNRDWIADIFDHPWFKWVNIRNEVNCNNENAANTMLLLFLVFHCASCSSS